MSTLDLGIDSPLVASEYEVAGMTRPRREERVTALIAESRAILANAITEHVTADDKILAGIVILFSGGNDSTTLAHMFRSTATHAAHANTTIGIEKTREFVRDTCAVWHLPLLEFQPPRETDHYRALVLDQGFPGPAHHFKMYQRLKERALEQVRRELVTKRSERVVFVAGRRRTESARRASVVESERRGSTVWVSPLVNWTKADLNTYRLMFRDVPRNEASDLIHMSGECLCGSFAAPNEREEITYWFPSAFDQIADLEALIAGRPDIADHRKTWGWGADPLLRRRDRLPASKAGALCSSCESKWDQLEFGEPA